MRRFFLLYGYLFVFVQVAKTQNIDTLIQHIYDAYYSQNYYSDEGQFHLELTSNIEDRRSESSGVFSTQFNRENGQYLFNLEMITSSPYYEKKINIERATKKDLSSFRVFFNEVLFENDTIPLNVAVGNATGISHELSSLIARLLMPEEITGRKLFENRNHIELLEQEKLDETACFKIKIVSESTSNAKPPSTIFNPLNKGLSKKSVREYHLWIDQKSYLIKQIKKVVYLENSTTNMTITFEPGNQ